MATAGSDGGPIHPPKRPGLPLKKCTRVVFQAYPKARGLSYLGIKKAQLQEKLKVCIERAILARKE